MSDSRETTKCATNGRRIKANNVTDFDIDFENFALGLSRDLLELSIGHRKELSHVLEYSTDESSEGELAAMVSFAIAFPDGFMALVDTYDVKRYFVGF